MAHADPHNPNVLIDAHGHHGAPGLVHVDGVDRGATQGTMDITTQERTFAGFMSWVVRSAIVIGVVLVILALTRT